MDVGQLPRTFGRFVLFDHIGRGGMADIFLARMHTSLGGSRNVVVKQILPRLSADAAFAEMLIAEAKLAAQLNHAHVVQVFDLGRESDRLFIAMDYVEGFDLRRLLARLTKSRIALPAEFALQIIADVLRALDYAHRARDLEGRPLGIVHRDVSPSNVLISFEGEVKLCDFGIARAMHSEGPGIDENAVMRSRVAGKSAYMAPEHARGDAIDARADVFAAGILLWELSAGRRLYRGTEEQMLELARTAQVPPLPPRGFPQQGRLQSLLDRALQRDPAKRYTRAADFLSDLQEYAHAAKLMASPLRFGSFLEEHFAEEIVTVRRAREKAADQLSDAPKDFGPSSAPPPAMRAKPVAVPAAPPVPSELAKMALADAHDDAPTTIDTRPELDTSGDTTPELDTKPEVDADTKPEVDADTKPEVEVDPTPEVDVDTTPEVQVAQGVRSSLPPPVAPPPVRRRHPLEPFEPLWVALVLLGAGLVGTLVYFLLRS